MPIDRRWIKASLYAGLIVVSFRACLAQLADEAGRVGQFYAKEDGFSGNVIVYRDGKVISNKSYGLANVEWRIPVTEATRFAICSETKQFTAASILLLQEQAFSTRPTNSANTIPKRRRRGKMSRSASFCSTPPAFRMASASLAPEDTTRPSAHRRRSSDRLPHNPWYFPPGAARNTTTWAMCCSGWRLRR